MWRPCFRGSWEWVETPPTGPVRVRKHPRRAAFSLIELTVLLATVVGVTALGASLHRQMWEAAQLVDCRVAVDGLAASIRVMPALARARQRRVSLSIDAARGMVQLLAIAEYPTPYRQLIRTLWLPERFQIAEAPQTLTVSPIGRMSAASIVILAPSCSRLFRIVATETGHVQIREEPTS